MELLSFDCSLAEPTAIEAVAVVLATSWLAALWLTGACSAGLVATDVVVVVVGGGTVTNCSGSVGADAARATRQAKTKTLSAMFV